MLNLTLTPPDLLCEAHASPGDEGNAGAYDEGKGCGDHPPIEYRVAEETSGDGTEYAGDVKHSCHQSRRGSVHAHTAAVQRGSEGISCQDD